jgi:hypothetical protein
VRSPTRRSNRDTGMLEDVAAGVHVSC